MLCSSYPLHTTMEQSKASSRDLTYTRFPALGTSFLTFRKGCFIFPRFFIFLYIAFSRFQQLQQLHWLPIRLRIEFKILLITFKIPQCSAPKYIIDLISVLPPSRYDLRRNNKGILLSTPKHFTKVTMGYRSFQAAAPRLWNSLPISIKSACTKSDFKQKLKPFLFSKGFY